MATAAGQLDCPDQSTARPWHAAQTPTNTTARCPLGRWELKSLMQAMCAHATTRVVPPVLGSFLYGHVGIGRGLQLLEVSKHTTW